MDYVALSVHIDDDPDVRGYSGMTDIEVANSLNTETKSMNVKSMSGDTILQNIDNAEYAALTDAERQEFWGLLGIGSVDPWGKAADVMIDIFGTPTTTISNLQAARVKDVSDGEFYGLGHVLEGHVTKARAL